VTAFTSIDSPCHFFWWPLPLQLGSTSSSLELGTSSTSVDNHISLKFVTAFTLLPNLLRTISTSVGDHFHFSWGNSTSVKNQIHFNTWLLLYQLIAFATSDQDYFHFSLRPHPLQLKTKSTSVEDHIHFSWGAHPLQLRATSTSAASYSVFALRRRTAWTLPIKLRTFQLIKRHLQWRTSDYLKRYQFS
jgi:hypothetical protein